MTPNGSASSASPRASALPSWTRRGRPGCGTWARTTPPSSWPRRRRSRSADGPWRGTSSVPCSATRWRSWRRWSRLWQSVAREAEGARIARVRARRGRARPGRHHRPAAAATAARRPRRAGWWTRLRGARARRARSDDGGGPGSGRGAGVLRDGAAVGRRPGAGGAFDGDERRSRGGGGGRVDDGAHRPGPLRRTPDARDPRSGTRRERTLRSGFRGPARVAEQALRCAADRRRYVTLVHEEDHGLPRPARRRVRRVRRPRGPCAARVLGRDAGRAP